MFVRRTRSALKSAVQGRQRQARTRLSAVLVESRRVEGKPRQRVVRYLGSIRDAENEGTAANPYRSHLWRGVIWHLDDLGLTGRKRARIEQAIRAVVPRPTAAEAETVYAQAKAELARLSALLGV